MRDCLLLLVDTSAQRACTPGRSEAAELRFERMPNVKYERSLHDAQPNAVCHDQVETRRGHVQSDWLVALDQNTPKRCARAVGNEQELQRLRPQ